VLALFINVEEDPTCRVAMGWLDILVGVEWKLREAVEAIVGVVKCATAGAIVRDANRVESATRGMKAILRENLMTI
jgi:hypothetical protein